MDINISDKTMKDLVQAFTRSTKEDLKNNAIENEFVTDNGEDSYAWNYIFGGISNAAIKNGLRHIIIDRGPLWKCVAVLSENEESMFLFFKEKNLNKILSEFQSKITHYVPILLVKNAYLKGLEKSYQNSLFAPYGEDEDRIKKAKGILKEDFDKIKTVYIFSKEEIQGEAISVKLNLFGAYGDIVDWEDMTKHLSLDYANASAINSDMIKTTNIVKLKKPYENGVEKINISGKVTEKFNLKE